MNHWKLLIITASAAAALAVALGAQADPHPPQSLRALIESPPSLQLPG